MQTGPRDRTCAWWTFPERDGMHVPALARRFARSLSQLASALSDKWRDALADSDVGSWIAVAQGLDDLEDVSQLSGAFARKY